MQESESINQEGVLNEIKDDFTENDNIDHDNKEIGFIDKTNVYMFITNDKNLKAFLKEKYTEQKAPTLNYESAKTVKVSVEYLTHLLQILKKSKAENCFITVENDYPLQIKTDSFRFILDPRVEAY